jgi:hypothetical protein
VAQSLHRALLPQVLNDLRALGEEEDGLVDAALQAITDLAARRKTGRELGERHVSGDLTGTRRLKFDLVGQRPERFRVVYRLLPDATDADTVEVISVGRRGGHAVYLAAAARLREPDEET